MFYNIDTTYTEDFHRFGAPQARKFWQFAPLTLRIWSAAGEKILAICTTYTKDFIDLERRRRENFDDRRTNILIRGIVELSNCSVLELVENSAL